MNERTQIWLLRIVGVLAIALVSWIAYLASEKQPALSVSLVSLVSWFVGKLIAQPLPVVTMHALETLPPKAAEQAVKRLTTRPPPLPTKGDVQP